MDHFRRLRAGRRMFAIGSDACGKHPTTFHLSVQMVRIEGCSADLAFGVPDEDRSGDFQFADRPLRVELTACVLGCRPLPMSPLTIS
jgi:hypothetical protein